MSPARARTSYRPPRRRRELLLAATGVLGVVALTAGLLQLLAPEDATSTPPVFTIPTGVTSATTLPGGSTTTPLPATTPSTTPG
jgi:hypothetical protein